MTVSDKTQRLAWVVVQTANRTQARGSSVRLVVPRAPEVAGELEPLLDEAELLTVEKYLLERGYLAPANIGLRWGTYTITAAGFHRLEGGLLEEPLPTEERLRESSPTGRARRRRRSSRLFGRSWRRSAASWKRSSGNSTRYARSRQEPRRAPRRSGRGSESTARRTGEALWLRAQSASAGGNSGGRDS